MSKCTCYTDKEITCIVHPKVSVAPSPLALDIHIETFNAQADDLIEYAKCLQEKVCEMESALMEERSINHFLRSQMERDGHKSEGEGDE
jgi:hypothetical protein